MAAHPRSARPRLAPRAGGAAPARHEPPRDSPHPATTPPTPFQQIAAIALIFPLLSYVAFQDDYRGMRPWSPAGLLAISRKTWGSVDSRGRVGQKDL